MNALGKDRAQVCIGMQQERRSLLEFFVGLAQFPGGFLLLAQRLTALFQGKLKAIYHTQRTDCIEQQQRVNRCQSRNPAPSRQSTGSKGRSSDDEHAQERALLVTSR